MGDEKKKPDLEERFQEPPGWQWGRFTNARGASLRWGGSGPEKPAAHIVFVEGLSDFAEKNFELARDFNNNDCAFWIFDRQGQGMSGRMLSNIFKQHSIGFQHDVQDIIQFVKEVVPKDGAPVILMGQSTGGMIGFLAAHDAPELFAGASLVAPLLGMLNPAAKDKEAFWASTPLPAAVLEHYIPYGSDSWERKGRAFKQDRYSSDPARMRISDEWQRVAPGLRTGSATFGWAQSVCEAVVKIRDPDFLKDIKIPMKIFTAEKDILINNKYTFDAVTHLPQGSHLHFHNGKHELLMETDNIRSRIIRDTLDLIKKPK